MNSLRKIGMVLALTASTALPNCKRPNTRLIRE